MQLFQTLWHVLLRALMLPADCLLLLYDVLAVNLAKNRFTDGDCRDLTAGGGQACPRCKKYTHKWLFHLVCRDVLFRDDVPFPCCDAEEDLRIPVARNVLAIILGLILLCSVSLLVLFGPFSWGTDGPGDVRAAIARLREGKKAMRAGHLERALTEFRSALKTDSDLPRAAYHAGQCMEELNQPLESINYYRRATANPHSNGDAAARLAVLLYGRGRFFEAREYARRALQKGEATGALHAIIGSTSSSRPTQTRQAPELQNALELAPNDPIVLGAYARVLVREGQIQHARKVLDKANNQGLPEIISTLTRVQILWAENHRTRAVKELEILAEEYPEEPGVRLRFLDICLAAEYTEEAHALRKKLRKEYQYKPHLLFRLARVLTQRGWPAYALEIALQLQDKQEVAFRANVLAAEIFLEKNLLPPAKFHAEKAQIKDPRDPNALVLGGRISRLMGDADEARKQFKRAAAIRPADPRARYFLGRSQFETNRLDSAIKSLQEAVSLRPESGHYHFHLGRAYQHNEQPTAAMRHYRRATELLDNPYQPLTRLGMYAQRDDNQEEAVSHYFRAIKAAPREATIAANNLADLMLKRDQNISLALALAWGASTNNDDARLAGELADTLCRALIRTGNPSFALRAATVAAQAEPKRPARQFRLGLAHRASGHSGKAKTSFSETIELAPDSDFAARARRALASLQKNGDTQND
mgnify:FL=1